MDARILVVDDEPEIADLVEVYLKSEGCTVFKCGTGTEALAVVRNQALDLAILDVMLPDISGFTLCGAIRQEHHFPVVMLTAKAEDMDKITGLTIGADDYITKPFNPRELMARVKAQLRRYTRFMGMAQKKEEEGRNYIIGGLELNEDTIEFSVDGNPVKLTPIEFKILALLMKNPGRVFSAEEIYERVWNEKAINTDTIMVHVRNIRDKIEINPREPKYLKVVWGVGYKIEKQP